MPQHLPLVSAEHLMWPNGLSHICACLPKETGLATRAVVPGVVQANAGEGVGLQHPKKPWAQLPCSWDAVGSAGR